MVFLEQRKQFTVTDRVESNYALITAKIYVPWDRRDQTIAALDQFQSDQGLI